MSSFFKDFAPVQFAGSHSENPLAYRHYKADELVLGKSMQEHLRLAVCYWHTFCSAGSDMFGSGAFSRPWHQAGDEMACARAKADAAFDFVRLLNVPFYCFHDTDVAPEGNSIREYENNFAQMVAYLEEKQNQTGVRLLWGTANCFSNPRYAAGAATNPNPEIFALAATQVFNAMAATQRLGGENYVLWGGREGYETLLNTDLKREREQFGRFLGMVVEHKHAIGFKGAILIEPKPQEPSKHQYDYDTASVYGFLRQFGLEKEVKLNIEANHATLAGHSFQHEIAMSAALGVLGSVDANRGDPQNGWDTDQFPNSVEELTLVIYEILKAGGLSTGGFNFDAKVRRQSIDLADLLHGHVGAIDALALALKKAAAMIENDVLQAHKNARYAGWDASLGQKILKGDMSLQALSDYARSNNLAPAHQSGQQEYLENRVNQFIFG